MINNYLCDGCGDKIITKNVNVGTTPATLDCQISDGCDGIMGSSWYQVSQEQTPTHEWYRPGILKIANLGHALREHVKKGGLLLRKIK